MGLVGQGAIAIWNDITDQGRANFYEWHGREHIAERLSIPGFLRGRRYVAIRAEIEYFTLYETRDAALLSGPEYAEKLNTPTEWTLRSTAEFRNVARSLCSVEFSGGIGQGGLLSTWRYAVDDAVIESHCRLMSEDLLPRLLGRDGVSGAHLLRADVEASGVKNEEEKRRGRPNDIPAVTLMVEGWTDAPTFDAICQDVSSNILGTAAGVSFVPAFELYQLQISIDREA